ncbi:MAG: hypothetical protein EAZ92_12205 [Candidatus Kapaibacterium sp.]|nr:MAG: hypothetical protein EAZ92_12205 [Candidatus Kapabacteria bacterium]
MSANALVFIFAALCFFCGFLSALLSLPMLLKQVKPGAYGIRMYESFLSEEHWYKINCYGAKAMMLAYSLPMLCVGILLLVLRPHPFVAGVAAFLGNISFALLGMGIIKRYARRLVIR